MENILTTNGHSTLHMSIEGGVARIVFDNPPVNAPDATMMRELRAELDARTPPRERGVGHSDCFACRSAVDGPRTAQRGADTGRRTWPRGTDAQCRAPNESGPVAEARAAVRAGDAICAVDRPSAVDCRFFGARIGGGRPLPDALPLALRRLLAVESDRFDETFRAGGEGRSHPQL
ncbi:hypothetical protein ACFY1A_41760 [Streptomyces sp. NPDC001520]|uniref:hypothetical protein n=1 Tax=Streptomyces sp. NPDC001520 TaxID=3364581 RepID=UPI0036C8461B